MDNGDTATVADAWFVHDTVNSYYNGDYTLDADTLFLPDLRGFGTLPDLAIAESLDSTLKGDVSDLTSGFAMTTSFADGMALDTSIADILYRWAGVDEVDPGDRGGFDAQKREFMEHFFGQAFTQYVYRPDPRGDALAELQDAWDAVFYNAKAELLSQLDAGAIFDGTAIYNPYTGNFEGTKDILQGTIDDLQAAAPTDTTAHTQAYWEQVAQIIDVVKGFENLTTGENTMMDDAISATDATLSWNGIEATALPRFFGYVDNSRPDDDTISGTIFGDNIDGGAGNDTISGGSGADTLHGGTGNDLIYGDGDNDTVYGDAGNDELHGGDANDTIYEGDGNDTLYGDAGNDTIDPARVEITSMAATASTRMFSTAAPMFTRSITPGPGRIRSLCHQALTRAT